ncbi:hypothetical protein GAPWK_1714 [Gilliamella apicola]|nr:hypothetical protein GAPWK_1714 [Gilliamella apicola]
MSSNSFFCYPSNLNDQNPEFQYKVQWSGKLPKNQPLVFFGFDWK